MKVHLVDGTFELFRAYFGSPGFTTADGAERGAVRGLVRSLVALLHEPDVTHVGVAFDHVVESFRNGLYPGYKTGEGLDPVLYAQFGPAEEACRALGLVVWPMVEFEADDALATAAWRAARLSNVEQVVICSPDKDLAQCVRGTRVVCHDRMRRTTLDEDGVRAKFGVGPESVPDWLALVGDSADGYPGIPRWGEKSAAAVLSVYGAVERIPDAVENWTVNVRGAAALAANLADRREEALLFKQLATLRVDAPATEPLTALHWGGPEEGTWPELVEALDLARVAERVGTLALLRKDKGRPRH